MINYIGLDFEASGSNPWGEHVPIQIGIALNTNENEFKPFQSYIGKWDWNQFEWNLEAEKVHNIPRDIIDRAPPVWVVDIEAAAWLIQNLGHTSRMWNIPVGWNIAGYDRQFITRWMPNLNRLLSYRTVDLNALCLAKAEQSESAYKDIKRKVKVYAQKTIGGPDWHDALYDAKAALHSLHALRADENLP